MQRETHQSQELLERKDVIPIEIEKGIDLVDATEIAQNLAQNSRKVVDPEVNEILARQPLATKMIAIAEEQNLYFKDNSRKHKEMLQIFS